MKTISILLALVNSLIAGLIMAYSLSGGEIRDAAAWWLVIKVLGALSVSAVGALTWIGSKGAAAISLMPLGSLFLVALGAATAVWTLHLGLVTGDMEYYMMLFGASLMTQGTASLFGFSGTSKTAITP